MSKTWLGHLAKIKTYYSTPISCGVKKAYWTTHLKPTNMPQYTNDIFITTFLNFLIQQFVHKNMHILQILTSRNFTFVWCSQVGLSASCPGTINKNWKPKWSMDVLLKNEVASRPTARRRTIQPTVGRLVRGLDDRLSVGLGLLADRQE